MSQIEINSFENLNIKSVIFAFNQKNTYVRQNLIPMNPIEFHLAEPRLLRIAYMFAYLGLVYFTVSTTIYQLPFLSLIAATSSFIMSVFFMRITQRSIKMFEKINS